MEELKEEGAQKYHLFLQIRRIEMETRTMGKNSSEMTHKRKEMELEQQQREVGLLAKGEAMELAATQCEMELEIKLKRLQWEDTNGVLGNNLSSASSSLRAEKRTKNWWNAATNNLDNNPEQILTVQEVNG